MLLSRLPENYKLTTVNFSPASIAAQHPKWRAAAMTEQSAAQAPFQRLHAELPPI